ncbi:MAG: SUMF1/EgtB/PvdO family nonheme iron enzyme [Candidatus Poribacteria bacterium]|nr:SUMF1/EgtB/PvdO family nonheme iron enzyme [Candidatus Poribacteria bacterium]
MTITIDLDGLKSDLKAAWKRSDAVFDLLDETAWHLKPIDLRHPFLFYLGHLPAFAWNQVSGVLGNGSLHPTYDELFERGIDPKDNQAAEQVAIREWPPLDDVLAYRDEARDRLLKSVDQLDGRDDPLAKNGRIARVVIEHELMHHETLMYMFQRLDHKLKRRPTNAPELAVGTGAKPERVTVERGKAVIGADFDDIAFGWDNEFPKSSHEVETFTVESLPVTITSFREFVEGGGYRDPQWWRLEDWAWRTKLGLTQPIDWENHEGEWQYRGMFEVAPLDSVGGYPVQVSLAEARAYCKWKGVRLPTEPELNRAAYVEPGGGIRPYPWGDAKPNGEHGNFGWRQYAPVPVGSFPEGASAWGIDELVGNGWEWTTTIWEQRPGFHPYIRTYPGYSADFFDNNHYVIFGAAWPTDIALTRRSFRNWFQSQYPYVFATFRCVTNG